MEVLFVHPNFPGQFLRVAAALARMPGFRVFGIGDESWMVNGPKAEGVTVLTYPTPPKTANPENLHPYASTFNDAVHRAQQILKSLTAYKMQGLEPDIIITHPGWGDTFFLRDIFPGTKVIGLFEFYYLPHGSDSGFDHEFPSSINDIFRVRAMNVTQLLALDSCDSGFSPTHWQRSRFPEVWQQKLGVLHEGIDTSKVKPEPAMSITLADGTVLRAGDEVLTYTCRNFEPYRGVHIFMRALPSILAARPNCHVVLAGGDKKGYGPIPPEGKTYREMFLSEVQPRLDMSRVHFTGHLPYDDFLRVLQVSRLHVYLTYPFVLSWSMLEAMSAGCLVLASATPPVEEVITDGENGLLFPFHSPGALADRAIAALANPARYTSLRQAARQTIIDRYDFETVSLPAYLRLLTE